MRIALLIFMTLGVLVSAGMGGLTLQVNVLSDKASEASAMLEKLGDRKGAEEIVAQVKGYRNAGFGGLVVGLLSIFLAIFAFAKKDRALNIVGAVTILAAIVFIVLSPSFDTGTFGGASPRIQAMIFGIAGIVAAATGLGAGAVHRKRVATAA